MGNSGKSKQGGPGGEGGVVQPTLRTGRGPRGGEQVGRTAAAGSNAAATVTPIPTGHTAPTPAPSSQTVDLESVARKAEQLRRARQRQTSKGLALWVGLPTLLAIVYYAFVITPRYESIALVTVRSTDKGPAAGLESLVGAVGGGSDRDAVIVTQYTLSREMLSRLNADGDFTKHFGDPGVDYLSRLGAEASAEDTYDYYLRRVNAEYDSLSGVVTFTVEAFTPDRAERFTQALIESSETMVNSLAERVRRDQTRFASKEVKRAEQRLAVARGRLLELQGSNADFSPGQSATEALSVRGQLQAELSRARAELAQVRAFMQPGAAKVVALSQRVASLAGQVKRENKRLVNTDQTGLNASLVDFEEAALEKEFAEKAYASALSALEMVRLEAAQQQRYLVTIAPPSRAEESTRPPRVLRVISVFLLALMLFATVTMLGAAIREHARL